MAEHVIDVLNVLEYYGDITRMILEEVLHSYPDITHFTFYEKKYDADEEGIRSILIYWSKLMRG